MNLLWCYFFFLLLSFWLRDFITKRNAMSFRIQGVLLDFRAFILSEWICLSSYTHFTLLAVHIFLKQPLTPSTEINKRVASNVPIVEIDVTTKNEWEGPRELVRPWGSGVGSAVHCSGVTSDNGPAVNCPAVTSRNCVLDPHKNETLDVVTSKTPRFFYITNCLRRINILLWQLDQRRKIHFLDKFRSLTFTQVVAVHRIGNTFITSTL